VTGRTTARLAASSLVLEALLVFFATLAALPLLDRPASSVWLVGGGLGVACLVVAGLVRRRIGIVLGTLLQVAVVATGFWLPAMFFMGAVFAGLWLWMVSIGARIDRETAVREAGSRVDAVPRPPDEEPTP
jgi:hypothetical protein